MSIADQSRPAPSMSEAQKGVVFAVLAHFVWGGMAAYLGLLRHISPIEIAANRGLWALPIALVIVWSMGQLPAVRRTMANPRMLAILTLTSFIIVLNWAIYIWSIQVGRTLESSLGYFINPLLNVVVGYLFLGERFTRPQLVALALAAIAVAIQTISAGVFPWLGLLLATTFCLYGFLRKTIPVGPTEGFLIETAIIAVPLLAIELWLASRGTAHFGDNVFDTLMLMGCGVLTAASLMFFAASVRRIRYSTSGLLQYLSPSLVFLTAVFIFHEPIGGGKLVSFVIIWLALAIFSWSALRGDSSARLEPAQ